ncbi:hypothetical protein NZD85_08305 [Empedobacter stercoris]|uniref:hypothetical protein n=1 Tax=Empedobacter stercoris TaxID=1628248 RepID=UPI0021AFC279|nr:hypothetical protein [Empedobacter stercoris]UWX65907.1 hypothetical protein NZD85_08305 [Empedobacter stercoris]
MSKIKLFNKGDVILTNPENGYYGIAIVLSETEKTPESHPRCHIAITPLIFDYEIEFSDLILIDLKPLEFERKYSLNGNKEFYKKEIAIGVYTRRNKNNFKIIGNINPEIIYNGPLPFEPLYDLDIKWPLYGDTDEYLGRAAYNQWKNNKQKYYYR